MPSARYTPSSSGASGSGSSAATYAGAPVARTSAVPKRSGSAAASSIGTPSTVTPTALLSACSITATTCGSSAKRSSTGPGSAAAQTTISRSQVSRQRRTSPAGSPPSAAATPPTSSRARLSSNPRRARLRLPRERFEQLGLDLRADAGHGRQAPGRCRLAELLRGAHAERAGDLDRPLGPEPEIATEPDEAGRQLALELGELRDVAGLDQLAQPRIDARADPAQLADATRPHQVGHGNRRSRGSSRRPGDRRAPCSRSRPRARAATRRRRGGRRCVRCPPGRAQPSGRSLGDRRIESRHRPPRRGPAGGCPPSPGRGRCVRLRGRRPAARHRSPSACTARTAAPARSARRRRRSPRPSGTGAASASWSRLSEKLLLAVELDLQATAPCRSSMPTSRTFQLCDRRSAGSRSASRTAPGSTVADQRAADGDVVDEQAALVDAAVADVADSRAGRSGRRRPTGRSVCGSKPVVVPLRPGPSGASTVLSPGIGRVGRAAVGGDRHVAVVEAELGAVLGQEASASGRPPARSPG